MRNFWILFSLLLFLAGCGDTPVTEGNPREPITAIVAAYDPEIEALIREIGALPDSEIWEEQTSKGVTYYLGKVHGEPIVLFVTGMSIANAAMTMQMAIDRYPVARVLYAGIAGGVNPELNTGDVVVPERWYYHDESAYFNPDLENENGYIVADYFKNESSFYAVESSKDPHHPQYSNYGMIFPDEVLIIKEGMEKPEPVAYFVADAGLLSLAQKAIDALPALPVSDERTASLFVGGNGVTGSVFLDNADYRLWVREVWNAEVTEMESAAVGQVCFINEVPWVIIRGVSDLAGGQEGKNEENLYDDIASTNAARVLLKMLELM